MKYFIFIFFLVSVFGCTRKNQVPGDVIQPNDMRKIMWDLMRADAYVNDFIMKDSTCDRKTESLLLYKEVFAIHSTSQEAFENSLRFYETRPDLLKIITDSLRSDEKKVQTYQDYKRSQQPTDTAAKKIKPTRKLIQNKQ